tara:strand:+ start:421 stop:621 length:201 start_codon:yes stop_codon:yes gene_type:complete
MGKLKELFLSTRIQQLDRDAMIEDQLNNEYARCCEVSQAWANGEKNPTNGTIQEYEFSKSLSYGQR